MKRTVWAILLIILYGVVASAQEMPVPIKIQYELFLKILTYDRSFKKRVGDEIVIGIVYQRRFRISLNVKNELVEVIEKSSTKKLEEIPIRYVPIDLDDEPALTDAISRNSIDILYVAPLRALELKTITELSRQKQVMTLTGVPDYVKSGLAVGIGLKGKRPQIIINLPAAKAEGVDFRAQLLKVAKIIK